jgi:acetyltransferase
VTGRNLDAVFRPRSVAVIGASARDGSIGRVLVDYLTSTFAGPVRLVNPKYTEIAGHRCYPSIATLPEPVDLAVIATPASGVPRVIEELVAAGTRGAVVISAGFNDRTSGRDLKREMLEAARPGLLRIVGPNTLGIAVPGIGLNASFSHLTPLPGRLAFLAQSGAIATSVLDWAQARGIGFSHLVSLGDMADVDFGDMLDYLANDVGTSAVLLYVEAITNARKFMSAARAAARMKPVIVVKGGRHAQSMSAAASHTGRLAGPDAEYDAAFRRAGMLRVASLAELFDAVETLALVKPPRGRRLAILSNGGGLGVLAADALLDLGGELPPPSVSTIERLDAVLPPAWSRSNPIDIVGDANAERYAAAIDIVLDDPAFDALLVLHCPTATSAGTAAARAVCEVVASREGKTVLASWLGQHTAQEARAELHRHRIPSYETPEAAVRGFMQIVRYRHSQEVLLETPPSQPALFTPDVETVARIFAQAREERREWLTHVEGRRVLHAYGIPVVMPVEAATPEAAASAAEHIGGRVALKIVSPSIVHKSDVGGVVLDLASAAEVEAAARAMLERARAAYPNAVLALSVEPMIDRRATLELIAGVTSGSDFGPMVVFGEGGTAVEVIGDSAVELPPLNLRLARDLIARTRVSRRMRGYRDVPPVDVDGVALVLTRLAQLLVDFKELREADINPLLAGATGVTALDARIRIYVEPGTRRPPLAIRPYPKELEETITLASGRALLLRPILPEDEPALHAGFARLTPDEIRARFFVPMKRLPHLTAARFTQIDYDRAMALVLAEPDVPGKADIHAVVQLAADPDNQAAEFAILVEKALTGQGLGSLLLRRLIDYARRRGIGELHGEVLADNATMRALCRSLGFTERVLPETQVVRVSLRLDT